MGNGGRREGDAVQRVTAQVWLRRVGGSPLSRSAFGNPRAAPPPERPALRESPYPAEARFSGSSCPLRRRGTARAEATDACLDSGRYTRARAARATLARGRGRVGTCLRLNEACGARVKIRPITVGSLACITVFAVMAVLPLDAQQETAEAHRHATGLNPIIAVEVVRTVVGTGAPER